jgi:hypothetical protein
MKRRYWSIRQATAMSRYGIATVSRATPIQALNDGGTRSRCTCRRPVGPFELVGCKTEAIDFYHQIAISQAERSVNRPGNHAACLLAASSGNEPVSRS